MFGSNYQLKEKVDDMKKHYRIANPIRFFIFILLCVLTIAFTVSTIVGMNKANATSVSTYRQIVIQADDTLWNIAEEYCSDDIDLRDYISDVCEINDINVNNIQVGDVIFVPVYS